MSYAKSTREELIQHAVEILREHGPMSAVDISKLIEQRSRLSPTTTQVANIIRSDPRFLKIGSRPYVKWTYVELEEAECGH